MKTIADIYKHRRDNIPGLNDFLTKIEKITDTYPELSLKTSGSYIKLSDNISGDDTWKVELWLNDVIFLLSELGYKAIRDTDYDITIVIKVTW